MNINTIKTNTVKTTTDYTPVINIVARSVALSLMLGVVIYIGTVVYTIHYNMTSIVGGV